MPQTRAPLHALHLLTLASWAVAQPLFDQLGSASDFLVAHGVRGVDLILLVVGLTLLPALPLIVVGAILRGSARSLFQGAAVGLLAGMIVLPALARYQLPDALHWLLASILGIAAAWGYLRFPTMRSFVTLLSPSLLVFPVVLLAFTPARSLLEKQSSEIELAEVEASAPVVMLILDELPLASLLDPEGSIDGRRFPQLARLASMSTWYSDTTTAGESTTAAVPAILTGRYPQDRQLATTAHHPQSLFTLLGGSYRMKVLETLTRVCPEQLCDPALAHPPLSWRALLSDLRVLYLHLIAPPGMKATLPAVTASWRDFEASSSPDEGGEPSPGDVRALFDRFLDEIEPGEPPALHLLHLNLPHLPWKFLPSGHEYGPVVGSIYPHGIEREVWSEDPWHTVQGLQRYLLQLSFVDRLVGRLLDRLEEVGMIDEVVFVLTADHGAAFTPGFSRRSGIDETAADTLLVPLFLKRPGQTEGVVDDRPGETIDILPTLAELLEAEIPWPVDGRSLLDPTQPGKDRRSFYRSEESLETGLHEVPRPLDPTPTRDRILEIFGTEPGDLFRVGPRPDLLDLPLDSLEIREVAGLRIHLDEPWFLNTVDLESHFRPSHLTGRIEGRPHPIELAIAVNGTVHATTHSYEDRRGNTRFSALVPESSWQGGQNRVDVFVIGVDGLEGPEGGVETVTARLVTRHGKRWVLDPEREPIQLVPGVYRGYVRSDGRRLLGWVGNVEEGIGADLLLVFVDRQLQALVRTGRRGRVKPVPVEGGQFQMLIPFAVMNDPGNGRVRYVALGGQVGSEVFFQAPGDGEARYELRDTPVGEDVIVDDRGNIFPLASGIAKGFVDARRQTPGELRLAGWVAHRFESRPADEVVAFHEGRMVALARRTDRPGASRELPAPPPGPIGFEVNLPGVTAENEPRIIAIFRDQGLAAEISFLR